MNCLNITYFRYTVKSTRKLRTRAKTVCLILFLAFALFSFRQISNDDLIWTNNKKLKWENFKAVPNSNSEASAAVVCKVRVDYYSKKDTLFVTVRAVLVQSQSWYRKKYKLPSVLQHEQMHFNAAEVYARNLRMKIMSLKTTKLKAGDELNALAATNEQELNIYQDLYDNETDHGRNKAKQVEWEKLVAKELKVLEEYENTEIKIMLIKN